MKMRSGSALQVKQRVPVSARVSSFRFAVRTLLVLAGVAVLCGPSHAYDETFHHVYPLGAGGSFVLENVNGSVHVEGWDRDEVEVSAVKTGTSEARDVQQVKIEVDNSKPEPDFSAYPISERPRRGSRGGISRTRAVPRIARERRHGKRQRGRARSGRWRRSALGEWKYRGIGSVPGDSAKRPPMATSGLSCTS